MPNARNQHLIFGGSLGIGYSYAKHMASKGEDVELVSRAPSNLSLASSNLLRHSVRIETHAMDVLDEQSLDAFLAVRSPSVYKTVFIGGPSPPPGSFIYRNPLSTRINISRDQMRKAFEICIYYPFQILEWAFKESAAARKIILIGSSTSGEDYLSSPFWTSSVFRRTLDSIATSFSHYSEEHAQIAIWRPKVVWTPLAERFAGSLLAIREGETNKERLKRFLNVDNIPSSDKYVEKMILQDFRDR